MAMNRLKKAASSMLPAGGPDRPKHEASHQPQGKRERIDTTPGKAGGSRFIRRDAHGRFTGDQVDVGRSLAADRRQHAKTNASAGNKNRGD